MTPSLTVKETGFFYSGNYRIFDDMKPISIKQVNSGELSISWDTDEVFTISLKLLRNECPCAECKGETILLHHFEPQRKDEPEKPEKYIIKALDVIGNYALQPTWGDGHSTGLYPWDFLYRLCVISSHTE